MDDNIFDYTMLSKATKAVHKHMPYKVAKQIRARTALSHRHMQFIHCDKLDQDKIV